MRIALPLAVVLASGCDLAFGLEDRDPPVTPDAPPIDAGIDEPPSCDMESHTVSAVADTTLMRQQTAGMINCNPANRQGTGESVNVGQMEALTRSRAIVRFSLSPRILDALAAGDVVRAYLTLTLRPTACGAEGDQPCPSDATTFDVFAVNDDWHEGLATGYVGTSWCARKQESISNMTPWQVNGADGAMDRSMLSLGRTSIDQGTASTADQVLAELTLGAAQYAEIEARRAGNRLSLILIPTDSGTLYVKAQETGEPVTLTVTTCR